MDIVVMKFGGTSVRDQAMRYQAFRHIRREVSAGYKVVVVVSAMGRHGEPYATDSLKELVTYHVSKREYDRLLSCGEILSSIVMSDFLQQQGLKVTSLAPSEVGIKTDTNYTNANIITVEIDKMMDLFNDYDVLVAPGFLGTTDDGSITTLGRGGSDTSAVALGGALKATYVDIYSDVEGVMTADPKLVKNARVLEKISYDSLIALAARGAKVIHLKAIELAKKNHVNLRLRSTSADHIGTYVVDEEVTTLSLTYKAGYTRYEIFGVVRPIECHELVKHGEYWYAQTYDEEAVEKYLKDEGLSYEKHGNYVQVSWMNQQRTPMELTFYVDALKLEETLNFLHYNLI
ncbi:MAG: aspartate kinase [Turicibacter sp.]|jgi:aspartate kinase|uniref:amino acid kinase family protein n=1 Tax=unclassified Turicibacter TaxID=2638206 RepID=UPI00137B339D|nr:MULTISPECIES: aspartate kinase [unclassified Turicibacter]MCI8701580.1 aspartate kinase [Turicibacter sp.]MCI9351132.1 aspartate kinase [Turicibacter sp.]MCU7204170.1 aspartate kinase [Turicibacter sp. TA25]MCU7209449.1 aspartate kinase [Turicibacter sp. 1E2]NCE78397.1 aspartate kinase [Turicibacter sp. TS3]